VNRLAREISPYLLQHAGNPVDWYPWGEEAFERARREDKPIFLSIGYSTCHWCHVMERESFVDDDVARLLNDRFVAIKVDREERPDLDQHFMAVCQALTGTGGWPLTIVMTADKQAFFAGTYFPKSRRWERPGLLEVLPAIDEAWRTKRDEVLRSADRIFAGLEGDAVPGDGGRRNRLTAAVLDEAYGELAADFDRLRGGFGGAPKFPMPQHLAFLIRYWQRTGRGEALGMAGKTLKAMRRGGLFDQLGFGFHRYATDVDWLVPHFEKMLYDQALLAEVYADAFAATGRSELRRTAAEIADYVLRDLAGPEGGLATAEDADSEGEEGAFYLWTREEFEAVLGPEDAAAAARVFGLGQAGPDLRPGAPPDGRSVLHGGGILEEAESGGGIPEDRVEGFRRRLFEARERRPRPFKDTKVLADWNGLMIAGLAAVYRVTGDDRYLRAAEAAADFVLARLRGPDGELRHVFAAGRASVPAFLDDYAFLAKGLTALYETGYEPRYLETALDLVDRAAGLFGDGDKGGYFFAPATDAGFRRKEIIDGAVPSGNSVMFMALLRLARLTGRRELEERASRLAGAFATAIATHPRLATGFLCGLDYALGPSREVVVVGRSDAPETQELLAVLRGECRHDTAVLFKPTDKAGPARSVERLAPFTKDMNAGGGRAAAYVCSAGACLIPVASAAGLIEALRKGSVLTSARPRTRR
jgi:uncharacterized protein YyaL (SSP411 family)